MVHLFRQRVISSSWEHVNTELRKHTAAFPKREKRIAAGMEKTGVYRYESRRDSVEFFSPGPHSTERTATAASAVFNLVSTIIGGGILSLPYAFDKCGLVLSVVFMIVSASASNFSLYVIVSCSRRGRATSYEQVVRKALGEKAGLITVVLLVLLTFLSMVAYVILTRDLAVSFAKGYFFDSEVTPRAQNLLTIACLAVISPIFFFRKMNSLRFTSVFSLISVLVLACAVSYRALHEPQQQVERPIKWWPSSARDVLYAFPIMCVSFLCHFNVLPVYRELHRPTRHRLKRIVITTMFSAWSFYMIVGIMGYLFAYRSVHGVQDDILNNFDPRDDLINIGRLGLLVTILLSLPLLIQPCRSNLIFLVQYLTQPSLSAEDLEPLLRDDGSEEMTSGDDGVTDNPDLACSMKTHILLTLSLISLAVALAFDLPGVSVVWNVMGSTVGLLISYVLPCLSYVCIRTTKPHSDHRKAAAWVIFVASSIVCAMCSCQSLASFW